VGGCFLAYRFCSLHSSLCMRLFVLKNNERMIKKVKYKKMASKPMKSRTIGGVVFIGTLAIPELDS